MADEEKPEEAPPEDAPPAEAPPEEAAPAEAPPEEAPPAEAPPEETPPAEAPPAAEEAPADAPPSSEEAPPAEEEMKDKPIVQASTASIKKQVSLITEVTPAASTTTSNQSKGVLKGSGSSSKAGSKLGMTPSQTLQPSSKVTVTPSKATIPNSRLELIESSKISLSRTGLSPSVMAAGSRAVIGSQIGFSASKGASGSKGVLDRTASRADRQKSLDQRVNLARQAFSGSTMSIRHIDYEAEKNKGPRYMNTYRMDSKFPFNPDKVEKIIQDVFDLSLEEARYEPRQSAKLAMTMSAEIRNRVKAIQYERYKIVVVVDIGEKQAQSLYSGFRFLWDVERDFYSMYKYENVTLFAVGCCYGVYHE